LDTPWLPGQACRNEPTCGAPSRASACHTTILALPSRACHAQTRRGPAKASQARPKPAVPWPPTIPCHSCHSVPERGQAYQGLA